MSTGCDKIVISIKELSKVYKLYDDPIDRVKESIIPFGKQYHKEFYAINNVSFDVKQGETVGLMGRNGSGKSTLLKMITGVLSPTAGEISINGKISALLELGAGFNPELSGMENIFLHGTIMGYSREQIEQKLEAILSFADIGDFIHQPVKVYSSGMFVRLAFAVSINVDPDILIVDEALSVGDMRFQQKCLRKIEEFKNDKTVLFVSHDLSAINKFCDRAIWLNEGVIMGEGSPEEISKEYRAFMIGSSLTKYEVKSSLEQDYHKKESVLDDLDLIAPHLDVLGDDKARITAISVFDAATKEKLAIVSPGQVIRIVIKVQYYATILNPIVGFSVKDRLGNIVTQSNSYVLNETIPDVSEGTKAGYSFEFTFPNLRSGYYYISPAVASGSMEEHVQHCWVHDALIIQVIDGQPYDLEGYLLLPDIEFSGME